MGVCLAAQNEARTIVEGGSVSSAYLGVNCYQRGVAKVCVTPSGKRFTTMHVAVIRFAYMSLVFLSCAA